MSKVNTTTINDKSNIESVTEEVQKMLGKSWYEVEEEERLKYGRKSLTRVVFVSLFDNLQSLNTKPAVMNPVSNLDNFTSKFETMKGGIALASSDDGRDPVAALGFLEFESPQESHTFLQRLYEEENLGLKSTRILLVSDDCPSNEFGTFHVYRTIPHSEEVVDIDSEGPVFVFGEIMKRLCQSSLTLSNEARSVDGSTTIKSIEGKFRKMIPSVNRLIACAKYELYPTLAEYLDMFHSPIYLELESELTSPLVPIVDWDKVKKDVMDSLTDRQ